MARIRRQDRILAVNVGNSSVQGGLFQAGDLSSFFSLPHGDPDALRSSLGKLVRNRSVAVAVAATVAPRRTRAIARVVRSLTGLRLELAEVDRPVPLRVRYRPRKSLGADRLLNGFAADRIYRRPTIVVDLGTAVTLDVVDGEGTFLGGAIAPGLEAMAHSLACRTELLPVSDLRRPRKIVAGTTREALRVGLRVGFDGLVSRLILETREELGVPTLVVATGGGARPGQGIEGIDEVDPHLTLRGLALLADHRPTRAGIR